MINGNIVFDKNGTKTIRKKVKKSEFFGIFRSRMDNFWIKFRMFWITVDNL